jgi:hypothetical protein
MMFQLIRSKASGIDVVVFNQHHKSCLTVSPCCRKCSWHERASRTRAGQAGRSNLPLGVSASRVDLHHHYSKLRQPRLLVDRQQCAVCLGGRVVSIRNTSKASDHVLATVSPSHLFRETMQTPTLTLVRPSYVVCLRNYSFKGSIRVLRLGFPKADVHEGVLWCHEE